VWNCLKKIEIFRKFAWKIRNVLPGYTTSRFQTRLATLDHDIDFNNKIHKIIVDEDTETGIAYVTGNRWQAFWFKSLSRTRMRHQDATVGYRQKIEKKSLWLLGNNHFSEDIEFNHPDNRWVWFFNKLTSGSVPIASDSKRLTAAVVYRWRVTLVESRRHQRSGIESEQHCNESAV